MHYIVGPPHASAFGSRRSEPGNAPQPQVDDHDSQNQLQLGWASHFADEPGSRGQPWTAPLSPEALKLLPAKWEPMTTLFDGMALLLGSPKARCDRAPAAGLRGQSGERVPAFMLRDLRC